MVWLYIIGGVVVTFVILIACNKIRFRRRAKALGISLEDYRKQEQERVKIENQKRRAEAENAKFIAQYGMPKSEWLRQRGAEARRRAEALKEKQYKLKTLDEQNGGLTSSFHSILPDYSNREIDIRVYEKTQCLVILYNQDVVSTIPFGAILSCRISEQSEIVSDNAITTTTTNTSNMVKRGLVGGVILGGVGALAGAATARQTSETKFGSQRELKSQYLLLTLNSLSTPNLTLYFGTDLNPQQVADFRKALSIFDIVVSRNNTNGLSASFDGQIDFNGVLNIKDCDALFVEVARFATTCSMISTTMIQRKFEIGFRRASLIMDGMEVAGIVGAPQGGNPRAVLVSPAELERILNG